MKEYLSRNRKPAIILIATFIAFSIVNVYQVNSYEELKKTQPNVSSLSLIRGDEPFYLAITSDIIRHHSIYMEDFFDDKNPDPILTWPSNFYNNPATWISYQRSDGHYISNYNMGLPYLLIPGYALGGLLGVFTTMSVISSLTSAFIYKFTSKLTTPRISFVTTIIFSFSTLLFTYSNQVYPDVAITLFLISSLYFIFEKRQTVFWSSVAGAILGYGIFLKLTFVVLDVVLVLTYFILLLRHKDTVKGFVFFCIFFTVIIACAELNNFYIYHSISGSSSSTDAINSAFGISGGIYSNHSNIKLMMKELIEVFFGKYHGVFIFSPVIMLFVLGVKPFYNYNRFLFTITLSITILIIASYTWINPISSILAGDPPFRYFIPLIPLLAMPFALGFQKFWKNLAYKIMITVFSSIGIGFSLGFVHTHLSSIAHSMFKGHMVHLIYQNFDVLFPSLGPVQWE